MERNSDYENYLKGNVQVYSLNEFKQRQKLKLKRKRKITGVIIGAGLLLTSIFGFGCGHNKAADDSKPTVTTNIVQEAATYDNNSKENATTEKVDTSLYDNKEVLPYDSTPVSMSIDSLSDFNSFLSEHYTDYKFEDFYGIDAALEKQASTSFTKSNNHTHLVELKNGKFDADAIVSAVISNNSGYLNGVSDFKKSTLSELSKSQIKDLSVIIADTLNTEIEKNPNINIDELRCVVGNLKMFSSISTSNAYVNSDDCLAISPNMINLVSIMNSGNKNVERDIIVHEAMHLIQKSCADNQNDVEMIGVSRSFSDLDVNPLKWSWLLEGSAEKEMCNVTGDDAITYKYKISYLDSLTMSTMLKDDVTVNQTESLCFQNDPEKLYQQFGCQNDDEKRELIKMMYTTDILQSERDDFYDKYESVYGTVDNDDELIALQRQLKVPICETLTKEFYQNLGSLMNSQNISIDDMNFLIRTFEGDVNSHLDCANSEKAEDNVVFMNDYITIQDKFFEEVSDSTGYSYDDLLDKYNNYVPNESSELLSTIDSSKKDFALYRLNDVGDRATYNIRDMKEMVSGSVKTK